MQILHLQILPLKAAIETGIHRWLFQFLATIFLQTGKAEHSPMSSLIQRDLLWRPSCFSMTAIANEEWKNPRRITTGHLWLA
jgi:hypothetical protein